MQDNYLIAIGFNGKISDLGVNTLDSYIENDKKMREEQHHGLIPPILESDPLLKPILIQLEEGRTLTEKIQEEYTKLCNPEITNPDVFFPCPFGDFIKIYEIDNKNYFMTISHNAYPKPGLAIDLGVVIKGQNEEKQDVFYLVTGVRSNDPGKGKAAWLGGFRNVGKGPDDIFKFDSGSYALLHEAIEEAGLRIEHDNPEKLRVDYTADNVPVKVTLGKNKIIETVLQYLDTIPTSDLSKEEGGEVLADGSKRVYATSGYLIIVDIKNQLINKDVLSEWLTPGDDINELRFFNITEYITSEDISNLIKELDFGI